MEQAHGETICGGTLINGADLCWLSVRVDRGWPETWELSHCGTCDAPWWTLEKQPDCYRLWRLPSRARYHDGVIVNAFPSADAALRWIREEGLATCSHDDMDPQQFPHIVG